MAKAKQSRDDGEETTQVPPSFSVKVLIASCIFVGIVALALFLWYSIHVVLLIFAGVLIAILLRGLADAVAERTGLGHAASLAIVLLVLVSALGLMVWISWSRLVVETAQLVERLPHAAHPGIARRIVLTSSPPDGVVADFFAGSGTTGAAAYEAGRRFLMVDCNAEAVEVMASRFAAFHAVAFQR